MANPYPPNQGMHGMQPQQQHMQPQMPPQQMHQQPPRGPNVTKGGTSRAVPVVVSAGLAIGVFCGLLFGVGIPDDANAGPSTGNNVKSAEVDTTPTPTPTASSSTATKPTTTVATTKPVTNAGSAAPTASAGTTAAAGTTAGAGSAATGTKPAAGAGSGSAPPTVAAAPALKKVKLIVEVKPDTVAATAKITVDKQDLTGGTMELEIPGDGKKEVKVVVKATGYKTVEQKVEVEGDVTVKVELIKRSGGGGGGTPSRPPTGGGKKKPAGSGLIDI